MPRGIDEKVWNRAKKAAADEGHTEDWPYVMSIYQNMIKGSKKESDLTLDIDKGDLLLGGKFKNKSVIVDEFGVDDLGQPTVNGKTLLTHRINKQLPNDKQKKTSGLSLIAITAKILKKFN